MLYHEEGLWAVRERYFAFVVADVWWSGSVAGSVAKY